MASFLFNSLALDIAMGNVRLGADTFYGMLVTSGYSPDQDAHAKRSGVTNEVAGTGYTAGGKALSVTVGAIDAANDRVPVTIGAVTWSGSTIANARGMVVYKRRGGAASADELVAYIDGGADYSSSAGDMTVGAASLFVTNG